MNLTPDNRDKYIDWMKSITCTVGDLFLYDDSI